MASRPRPRSPARRFGMHHHGSPGADGEPWRADARRLPGHGSRAGEGEHRRPPARRRAGAGARAAARGPCRARRTLEGSVMAADVTMRVWRGDAGGGEFHDYDVAFEEGEV